jgi:hypothetical protein
MHQPVVVAAQPLTLSVCLLPPAPQVADPEDACSPFTFSDMQQPWVALISRSQQLHPTNCTFDVKVGRSADVAADVQQQQQQRSTCIGSGCSCCMQLHQLQRQQHVQEVSTVHAH